MNPHRETVYLAQGASDGRLKLGATGNLPGRLAALRRAYGQKYTVVRTWHRPKGDALYVELTAHARLSEFRAGPIMGSQEHYETTVETVAATVEASIAWHDRPRPPPKPRFTFDRAFRAAFLKECAISGYSRAEGKAMLLAAENDRNA